MSKCTYCESTQHNIKNCPVDNYLYSTFMLNTEVCPKFEEMGHRMLKKLAALSNEKTSLPKVQLVIILKRVWTECQNNKNRETPTLYEESECPICLTNFEETNIAITKCGHKFCLECMMTHGRSNHTCPLCRADICKEVTKKPDTVEIIEDVDTFVNVTSRAVRTPDYQRRYHADHFIDNLRRQMDCYDSFEVYMEEHWSHDRSGDVDDNGNPVDPEEFNMFLYGQWSMLQRGVSDIVIADDLLELMNETEDIDVPITFEEDANVSTRENQDNNDNNRPDDLADILEIHEELVDLFENEPRRVTPGHSVINTIDLTRA